MVGSNGTMIAIRLVRSKLQKRENHSGNEGHMESSVVQAATAVSAIVASQQSVLAAGHAVISTTHSQLRCSTSSINTATTTCTLNHMDVVHGIPERNLAYANDNGDDFMWQFPPPYPLHTPPPQYQFYNDQDTLAYGLLPDRPGFAKGFRKNLGGRWRRLVKRKPETDTCAFPPELKNQLKTIYVY